ncbi:transcriptional regulator [Gammaproteobacteria bacterium]|nr:transcriptional regulator [Gammaproteobacteria bacterium]
MIKFPANYKFFIPPNLLDQEIQKMQDLIKELKKMKSKVGTGSPLYEQTYNKLYTAIERKEPLDRLLESRLDLRALGAILFSDIQDKVHLNPKVFSQIDIITPKPSSLFLEFTYQYFLAQYDQIEDYELLAKWLLDARPKRNLEQDYDHNILSINGAKWFAQTAIDADCEFDDLSKKLGLDHYLNGRFMLLAKQIYYVEQLNKIPLNQDHSLLKEVQKKKVYSAKYDKDTLLGHQVLRIIIERAPKESIADSWLDVIMAIAGDPRIYKSHKRYIRWWQYIDAALIDKVKSWLSKLDLKLFLEAIADYAETSGDRDFERMYLARKAFLEGLLAAGEITHTRLYLTKGAANYINRNYKPEHIPEYSEVKGSNSLIHVQMGDAHMIEGSHNCKLRIYAKLDPAALVFNYNRKSFDYYELTTGFPYFALEEITHNGVKLNWQKKALSVLNNIGITLQPEDVLDEEGKRLYNDLLRNKQWY